MLLLMLFALIAGAGTAITPCVLPVLPALLSASALGGRRRPLGIVLGLAATFTIAIVALAQLVKGVGPGRGGRAHAGHRRADRLRRRPARPRARRARAGAPVSPGAVRPQDRAATASGPGVGVGGALGFVCAPCAGPILAAVTSVSASSGASARIVAVALAYSRRALRPCCSSTRWAGGSVIDRIKRSARGHVVERTLGVVLLAHRRADGGQPRRPLRGGAGQGHEPARLPRRPHARARELERGPEPPGLAAPRRRRFAIRQAAARRTGSPPAPSSAQAPEFTDNQRWFNTPGGRRSPWPACAATWCWSTSGPTPASTASARCRSSRGCTPPTTATGWRSSGVETPEFTFEQDAGNVAAGDSLRRPALPGRPGQPATAPGTPTATSTGRPST